jgi:hypothetical protein
MDLGLGRGTKKDERDRGEGGGVAPWLIKGTKGFLLF